MYIIPPLLTAFLQYPMVPRIKCAHPWSSLTKLYLFWPLPFLTHHLLFQSLCGTHTPGTMTWIWFLEHTKLIEGLGLCTSCFLKTQHGHSQKSSLRWLLLTIQALALMSLLWKVDSYSHFSYYLTHYLITTQLKKKNVLVYTCIACLQPPECDFHENRGSARLVALNQPLD